MLNNELFGKRLQLLMDYYALSASAFADKLSIGRSSISHILSGRNKPSLEFVLKIVDVFDEVDLDWLLYGKGAFPKKEIQNIPSTSIEQNSFLARHKNAKNHLSSSSSSSDLFSEVAPLEKQEIIENVHEDKILIEKNTISTSSSKKIKRIVILYQDGTFDSYEQSL